DSKRDVFGGWKTRPRSLSLLLRGGCTSHAFHGFCQRRDSNKDTSTRVIPETEASLKSGSPFSSEHLQSAECNPRHLFWTTGKAIDLPARDLSVASSNQSS